MYRDYVYIDSMYVCIYRYMYIHHAAILFVRLSFRMFKHKETPAPATICSKCKSDVLNMKTCQIQKETELIHCSLNLLH